jgi:hypothetical protein
MKAYLKAKISEGCFSSENSVVLEGYYGGKTILTSGFFEKIHIKDGKLEVEVLEEIEKGVFEDSVFVQLPGRTLEAPGDKGYLTVKKRDLTYLTPEQAGFPEFLKSADRQWDNLPQWFKDILRPTKRGP